MIAVASPIIDVASLAKLSISSNNLFTSFLWFNYTTQIRGCQYFFQIFFIFLASTFVGAFLMQIFGFKGYGITSDKGAGVGACDAATRGWS